MISLSHGTAKSQGTHRGVIRRSSKYSSGEVTDYEEFFDGASSHCDLLMAARKWH
jgi:hypothetical protein